MHTPTKAERISFWQHSYARASFVQTRLFIDLLLKLDPPMNDTLRRALTVAILGVYSRPFKQRKIVRLPDDIVPAPFRDTHDIMIEIRDKVVAHRDLDGPIAEWGFISQLQVNIRSKQMTIDTISSIISNDKAREILPLLDCLIAKMGEAATSFVQRYLAHLPSTDASTSSASTRILSSG
jgi:hypothetical protein